MSAARVLKSRATEVTFGLFVAWSFGRHVRRYVVAVVVKYRDSEKGCEWFPFHSFSLYSVHLTPSQCRYSEHAMQCKSKVTFRPQF